MSDQRRYISLFGHRVLAHKVKGPFFVLAADADSETIVVRDINQEFAEHVAQSARQRAAQMGAARRYEIGVLH